MNKAAQLAAQLEGVEVAKGLKIIEQLNADSALYFNVIEDAMCIMHTDGSVNIIDHAGKGIMTVEVISAENILRVLKHYRPFREVFAKQVQ